MARVQFSTTAVRRHGFPFACVLCGNDENPKVVTCSMRQTSMVVKVVALLVFFLGPVGWAIMAYLLSNNRQEAELPLPICDCCSQASAALNKRCFIWFASGFALCILALRYDQWWGPLLWLSIGFFSLALIEYLWVGRQFTVSAVRIERDHLLVNIPYEDYPSLYQRHMETVMLYGSNNTLGIEQAET